LALTFEGSAEAGGAMLRRLSPIRWAANVTLQDLGSLGEFVAAIATLATLVYLAVQIRQNTASVKAAAAQSILDSLSDALATGASSPEQARVLVLGQTDYERLSEDERMQFMFFLLRWFRVLEQAHHSYRLGHLDPSIWAGHVRHLEGVMQAPAFRRWWSVRQEVFSSEFRDFVEGLAIDTSSPGATRALVREMIRDEPAAQQAVEPDVE
jgi:hypothetical protein